MNNCKPTLSPFPPYIIVHYIQWLGFFFLRLLLLLLSLRTTAVSGTPMTPMALKPMITYYSTNFTNYHSGDTYSQEDALRYISQDSQSTSHLSFLPVLLVASCYLLLFFFWTSSCWRASGLKLFLVCFWVFFSSKSKRIPSLAPPVSFRCCDVQMDTPILNFSPKLYSYIYQLLLQLFS